MSYAASASSDAPTPARAVLDEWIAHMPFEGETPAERMMLRREAQEASAEQAAQELLADEVATKPKKGKANTKWEPQNGSCGRCTSWQPPARGGVQIRGT